MLDLDAAEMRNRSFADEVIDEMMGRIHAFDSDEKRQAAKFSTFAKVRAVSSGSKSHTSNPCLRAHCLTRFIASISTITICYRCCLFSHGTD